MADNPTVSSSIELSSTERSGDGDASGGSVRERAVVIAVVFASFLLVSAMRAPMPAVNEPHYLTKAMHYWDADFCPGDLFLESSNPHRVFYQTVGLLTRWLTLEQTAWVGRVLALLLLAVGWREMIARIVPGRWSSLWTAWVFLALAALGSASRMWKFAGREMRLFDLSGEWIVGGVESKVFAYAFVFWSIAWLAQRRWNGAAICCGLAISFHPLVGVWSLMSAIFAQLAECLVRRRQQGDAGCVFKISSRWVVPALLLVICSLPGLIPAFSAIGNPYPKIGFFADYIQVFHRLKHHLDPMNVPIAAYLSYVVLAVVWLLLRRRAGLAAFEKWFSLWVLGTVMVMLAGLVVGFRLGAVNEMPMQALRTKLLKFYPFRLADVMVPLAASIVVVGCARRWRVHPSGNSKTGRGRLRLAGMWCVLFGTAAAALLLPSADHNPSKLSRKHLADWVDTCRWIEKHTPADALFLTPTSNWGFKWYAHRAEFVSRKDCPQDAARIVEWNDRLNLIHKWAGDNFNRGYSAVAVGELVDKSRRTDIRRWERLKEEWPVGTWYQTKGITHIVTNPARLGPFELPVIYRNETYTVYRVVESKDGNGSQVTGVR